MGASSDIWMEPADHERYGTTYAGAELDEGTRALLAKFAATSVMTQQGFSYFDALVSFLYSLVGAEIILVGMLDPDVPGCVQTLAVFEEGVRSENMRYRLSGTPCSTVIGPRNMCVYARGVAQLFPRDEVLVRMNAEGYCGMPLLDASGRMIGLLAMVTVRPIEEPERLLDVLQVFGRRSSLELEHLIALKDAAEDLDHLESHIAEEERLISRFLTRTTSCEGPTGTNEGDGHGELAPEA